MHAELAADDAPPRLLAVVAHPDDETFGCGSLLLHAAAAGVITTVVCATRGGAGEAGSAGADIDLTKLREGELHDAARLLGVSRVELLDFDDSGMSGAPGPNTLAGADPEAVRDAVLAHIEDVRPNVVVTLDGGDGHRDHARIRDATIAAVDAARWWVERLYLQCLPLSLMRRWAEHMAQTDPHWEHLQGDIPGTPDELITTVVDTAAHLPTRERAIAAHASQQSPFEGLPTQLRRDFLTREQLRRLRPEWSGGPWETTILPQRTSTYRA